ncbi:LamB/YcsF family protein [Pelagibacteraceae bacterium]|nr:LamB/YcsF family protein [Pelagibacteraceae bacterium]
MEINLNCDLGETSKFCSTKNDPELLKIVNTANIACGYHAGDAATIRNTIRISKKNDVSVGAHPSFDDKENFGRKRINLTGSEIKKLITDQLEIISKIADEESYSITHVKPHGALNNMACENYEISKSIGEAILNFNKDLIYVCLPMTQMEKAARDLNMRLACEIFADRNYEDNGNLISRKLPNALITDPEEALKKTILMLKEKSIVSYSGKRIPCTIDTICLHGDGKTALAMANKLKSGLLSENIKLKKLTEIVKM